MSTSKHDPQLTAAAKKTERDRDAAQAMRDYEAEKRTALANMERLRALRLAKERADAEVAAKKSANKTIKAK